MKRSAPRSRPSPGTLSQLACLLEAAARKPGNIHPGRSFDDSSYFDFVLSAAAIAPAFARAPLRPLGETILAAVRATRAAVGKNTNLGIVILLAPLAALGEEAPRGAGVTARRKLRRALRSLLARLTVRDAALAYEAIRLAAPAGLGTAPTGDVRSPPPGTLLEMMALARERDLIARQYAGAYREVIEEGLPDLDRALRRGRTLEEAVILCFLGFLSRHGDSLIERKCGDKAAAGAARRAREVLRRGWPESRSGTRAFQALDRWLRSKGHDRNPGTSADLTAAVLFLALRNGIIQVPIAMLQAAEDAHGKV